MEIFRGLRDVEKHLLKFLPNRDVVRLQRVCKTWQNTLHSIELDRIGRIPFEFRGIWQNMITEKHCKDCLIFLFGALYAVCAGESVYCLVFPRNISLYLHFIRNDQIAISNRATHMPEFFEYKNPDCYYQIREKTRWFELFPEDL